MLMGVPILHRGVNLHIPLKYPATGMTQYTIPEIRTGIVILFTGMNYRDISSRNFKGSPPLILPKGINVRFVPDPNCRI